MDQPEMSADRGLRRPSSDATRARIVAAAIDVFTDRSFDDAAISEIARLAGVTQPLLNIHFRSKDELWRVSVSDLFDLLDSTLTARAEGLRGVDEFTTARLLVREVVLLSARRPQLHRIITGVCDGERMDWLVGHHIRPLHDGAMEMFARLVDLGLLPALNLPHHLYCLLTGAGQTTFVLAPERRRLTGLDPLARRHRSSRRCRHHLLVRQRSEQHHGRQLVHPRQRRSRRVRLANHGGRAAIVLGDEIVDVERASGGRFGPSLASIYDDWEAFGELADSAPAPTGPLVESNLGCPAPEPRQVFAIGLNYRSHAEESGMAIPEVPATFTKFPASLAGPFDDIPIVGDMVDWEVELVAVIGRRADDVAEADAWAHVAGLTIGQDISDRALQFAAGAQFSLGKSRRGYGPMGPWLVTPDELDDADDLALGCSVDGETVQDARTSDLIFGMPRLIAELSAILPLLPGDVIFTGTPAGVGFTRQPSRSLQPGNVLETWIEGIGTIRNRCV